MPKVDKRRQRSHLGVSEESVVTFGDGRSGLAWVIISSCIMIELDVEGQTLRAGGQKGTWRATEGQAKLHAAPCDWVC